MGEPAPTFGEERIRFSDPSGLAMELIAGDRDARTPGLVGMSQLMKQFVGSTGSPCCCIGPTRRSS